MTAEAPIRPGVLDIGGRESTPFLITPRFTNQISNSKNLRILILHILSLRSDSRPQPFHFTNTTSDFPIQLVNSLNVIVMRVNLVILTRNSSLLLCLGEFNAEARELYFPDDKLHFVYAVLWMEKDAPLFGGGEAVFEGTDFGGCGAGLVGWSRHFLDRALVESSNCGTKEAVGVFLVEFEVFGWRLVGV